MVFDEQTDAFVPVFYVLLTSKTLQIYRHALYWVKTMTQFKMRPTTISCDFEKALHNAIKIEFPTAIVSGCLFHWKQAIRRKIIDLKFDEPVVDRFMNAISLQTLTVIPPNEIVKYGIPYVRDIVEHELSENDLKKNEQFWLYFFKYWMSSPSVVCSWNVDHHPLEEKQNLCRTNNGLERYNRSLKEVFNNTTPSLIGFVENLEKETRNQIERINHIRKVLLNNKKRKREEDLLPREFDKPSIHYYEFKKNLQNLEKLENN